MTHYSYVYTITPLHVLKISMKAPLIFDRQYDRHKFIDYVLHIVRVTRFRNVYFELILSSM